MYNNNMNIHNRSISQLKIYELIAYAINQNKWIN